MRFSLLTLLTTASLSATLGYIVASSQSTAKISELYMRLDAAEISIQHHGLAVENLGAVLRALLDEIRNTSAGVATGRAFAAAEAILTKL